MIKLNNKYITLPILISGMAFGLSACSSIKTEAKYPTSANRSSSSNGNDIYSKGESILGKDGFQIFGSRKKSNSAGDSGIGVNSFLWRATLDTISFMPLASADPFGGVIITDWYTDPNSPNERVKINAFIMDRELKAEGVKVRTFRQELKRGTWRDAEASKDVARKLEDTILTRARQLRISHLAGEQ